MPTPRFLNTIGLGLNAVGVILLFRFGFPQPTHEEGVSIGVENNTPMPDGQTVAQHNTTVRTTKSEYRFLSLLALGAILFGIGFQVLALWWRSDP